MAAGFRILLLVSFVAAVASPCGGANVLGFFTSSSPSHLIVHMSYIKILLERGHNATVVTTIPIKEKHSRLHHIYVPPSKAMQQEMDEMKSDMLKKSGALQNIQSFPRMFSHFARNSRDTINDPRVQDLIHNRANEFDFMIFGYFMNDYELGVTAHLKCPIIISWMSASFSIVDQYVGNPPEISYVPTSLFSVPGDPLTFTGRLWNVFQFGITKLFGAFINWNNRRNYREIFPAPEYPPLEDILKRISLVFCNSHFSEGVVRPNVPALVEVGGIQIKDKPNPLPDNLRKIVDSASQHGVIYVSFGSNLDSKYMDDAFLRKIYDALASLKQTVLWKWDGKDKPGNAPNIHFEKWLPQDDLLAHPNMRLFITHAGKGSVAESQYHGVPMVAIPMFAEQPLNAEKIVKEGFGLMVNHLTMTGEGFRSVVVEVLQNLKYRENVKRFSQLYRDRPMTARETAAFWMEYVFRHKGAYHMQSPLVHLNGVQYLCLDVMGFLLVAAFVLYKLLKFVMKLIWRALWSRGQRVKKE